MKDQVIKLFRVKPGTKVHLKDYDPGWTGTDEMKELGKDQLKERAQELLKQNLHKLADAQELLWASDTHSVLIVLQGIDAAGKDGTIKHVMSGVNPQGCRVVSFKKPNDQDLDHNWLWRVWRNVPERGQICIFNRSHYEDVLVVRVHPELLDTSNLPPGKRDEAFWNQRYEDINAFERHLAENGTLILKFFLNLSKKEQKERFMERLDNPEKHWKFSAADLAERRHWDQYREAYEKAISATSTKWAPWHIIPADHKWVTRAAVAEILTRSILALNLRHPQVTDTQCEALAAARKRLEQE